MSTKKDIDNFFKDIVDSPSIYAKDHRSRRRMRVLDDAIIIPLENEAYLPYMKVGIALDNPYTQQMVIYAHKNNLPVFITSLPPGPTRNSRKRKKQRNGRNSWGVPDASP